MNLLARSISYIHHNLQTPRIIRTMYTNLIVEKQGHVTTIGINRPKVRNCVNYETSEELKRAVKEFEDDEEAYVAVLHGCGGTFCAGYDLKELSGLDASNAVSLFTETGTVGPSMRFIKKPMIAAVDGYAVAGGFELALLCDLRVMEENAIMGVFCRRFGVPLIDGGTVRLQAIVGMGRALDYILTGRAIPAKEAMEAGLANRVVAVGTALGQAIQLANSLVKFPQGCMNADRNSTYNAAFSESYVKLLDYERENGQEVILRESVQGAQKFMSGIGRHGTSYDLTEKPRPDWEKEEDEHIPKHKL